MIFPKTQTVFGLHAFVGNSRTHDLRQPIDIDRIETHALLDRLAHGARPGLGAEDAHFQRRLPRIQSTPFEFFSQRQHVGRRHHDDARFKIDNQLHLLFGLPTRHGHHRTTEPFRAVVRAQTPGEQAVAIGHVHNVPRTPTRGIDRSRDELGPDINVLFGIADHRGLARRARGGMDTHNLLAWHSE